MGLHVAVEPVVRLFRASRRAAGIELALVVDVTQ